jgi:hypothetical protein
MCIVQPPPGGNPIAVNKYININSNSSFTTKFAHAHYHSITGIISLSVDNRCITYISKGDCFISTVSIGTGLFHDAVDGACHFFHVGRAVCGGK